MKEATKLGRVVGRWMLAVSVLGTFGAGCAAETESASGCPALEQKVRDCFGEEAAVNLDCSNAEQRATLSCEALEDTGKADWIGNRKVGEYCSFNWQCDSPLICRPYSDTWGLVGRSCQPPGQFTASFSMQRLCDNGKDCRQDAVCFASDRRKSCEPKTLEEPCDTDEDCEVKSLDRDTPMACVSGICRKRCQPIDDDEVDYPDCPGGHHCTSVAGEHICEPFS